ncbi:unnamed protein product [Choristocarpus tenellus]
MVQKASQPFGRVANEPQMFLTLAEDSSPASSDLADSIISSLSLASSVLLLAIISGAVYVSLINWRDKRDDDKAAKGQLLPSEMPEQPLPPLPGQDGEGVEGNRYFRRMSKSKKGQE